MASTWFYIVLEVSVLVCGLVSGVFLTFSDFVMRSLDRAGTTAGVEVMQTINREVFRSVFMVLLLGMSALSPVIAGYGYYRLTGPVAGLIMAGGGFYFCRRVPRIPGLQCADEPAPGRQGRCGARRRSLLEGCLSAPLELLELGPSYRRRGFGELLSRG